MVMSGSDADALDALARQMGGKSSKIQGVSKRLGREIHGSPWHGRNADRFRRDWDGEYRRSLAAAASFLADASAGLHANARQQREASSGQGGLRFFHGRSFRTGFATIKPQIKSRWQRWLDGEAINACFTAIKAIGWFGSSNFLGLNKALIKAGILSGQLTSGLTGFLGVLGAGLSAWDLFKSHPYQGNFGTIEIGLDVMGIVSGGLVAVGSILLIPPATAIGGAVLAVGVGLGLLAKGIDLGLAIWTTHGRNVMNHVVPSITRSFNNVRGGVARAWRNFTAPSAGWQDSGPSTVKPVMLVDAVRRAMGPKTPFVLPSNIMPLSKGY